jgi:hypothetical protein
MLVLGKSNDDKGKQLESLTYKLLSEMGYRNVVTNLISAGGEEIDVSADIAVPNIGGAQMRRLICECKAHRNVISSPDWLKFLGKVLVEEALMAGEVTGCFIALGGVNGNVAGNYDKLKARRPNITLVTGDTLLDEVLRLYELCGAEKIIEVLRQHTARQYRALEIAYYEDKLYYVALLENDVYTILDAQGRVLEAEAIGELRPLVESVLSAHNYIDLREEALALRRGIQARKSVLAQVIINGGSIEFTGLETEPDFNFTPAELDEAVEELAANGWVVRSDSPPRLSLLSEGDEDFYERLTEVYRFLLRGEPKFNLPGVLRSPFYSKHINARMVEQIQRIQGGLPLSQTDVEDVVKLLRWSPSAVLWAVQPDAMIVTSRTDEKFKTDAQIDQFHRNYFFSVLYRSLRYDLTHPLGRAYLLDDCHIREIETAQNVIVKSSAGVQLTSDLHERLGIGQTADGYVGPDGSSYILVSILEGAEQPWEVPAWKRTDGGTAKATGKGRAPERLTRTKKVPSGKKSAKGGAKKSAKKSTQKRATR